MAEGVILGLVAVNFVVFGVAETNTHIRNATDIVNDTFDSFNIIFDRHPAHRLWVIVIIANDIVKFFPF
jgi:hypothetical protein